jgi:hypothetical protein
MYVYCFRSFCFVTQLSEQLLLYYSCYSCTTLVGSLWFTYKSGFYQCDGYEGDSMSKPNPGLGRGIARSVWNPHKPTYPCATLAHASTTSSFSSHPLPCLRQSPIAGTRSLWERNINVSLACFSQLGIPSTRTATTSDLSEGVLLHAIDNKPIGRVEPSDSSRTRAISTANPLPVSSTSFGTIDSERQAVAESPAATPTPKVHTPSFIFRIGASGFPKRQRRSPKASADTPSPIPLPFVLPQVTSPNVLRSISVGEDAYFIRADGMCVADGVGGWARSGRSGANASRWSQLLTHFCEVEVERWWAGVDEYMADMDVNAKLLHAACRLETAPSSSDDDAGVPVGKYCKPMDPIQMMQKGFEQSLACVVAEVSCSMAQKLTSGCTWVFYLFTSCFTSLYSLRGESGGLHSASRPQWQSHFPHHGDAARLQLPLPNRNAFQRPAYERCTKIFRRCRTRRYRSRRQRWLDGQPCEDPARPC